MISWKPFWKAPYPTHGTHCCSRPLHGSRPSPRFIPDWRSPKQIAVVTGASSGMGREFALQLSGFVSVDEIWVIARRESALEELKAQCPVPVRPIVLDLCDSSSFDAYAAMLAQDKPDVRLLVNAAGFGKFGAYHKVSAEDDCRMIDLNCKALLMMTRLNQQKKARNNTGLTTK